MINELVRVRELIKNPMNWTQNAMARAADGEIVGWNDDKACRWCLTGAIRRICGEDEGIFWKLLTFIEKDDQSLTWFNDYKGHEAVIGLLDKAIKVELIKIYKGVRELLNPGNWIQGHLARNSERGEVCSPTSNQADCFCLGGAFIRVVGGKCSVAEIEAILKPLVKCIGLRWKIELDTQTGAVTRYNDAQDRKFEDIASVLDKVIAALDGENGNANCDEGN